MRKNENKKAALRSRIASCKKYIAIAATLMAVLAAVFIVVILTDNMSEEQGLIDPQSDESICEIRENLETMYSDLQQVGETVVLNQETLENGSDGEDVTEVIDVLEGISGRVVQLQKDIEALMGYINGSGEITAEEYETILESYNTISGDMTNITINLAASIEEIDGRVEELSQLQAENYRNVIQNLTVTKESLTDVTQNFNQNVEDQFTQVTEMMISHDQELSDAIKTNNDSITALLNTQNQSMAEQNSGLMEIVSGNQAAMTDLINENQSELNEVLSANQNELNTLLDTNQTQLIELINANNEALNTKVDELDQTVESCFQSVSSGKKSLVSALLARYADAGASISLSDDPKQVTWAQLEAAVRNIPYTVSPSRLVTREGRCTVHIEWSSHYDVSSTVWITFPDLSYIVSAEIIADSGYDTGLRAITGNRVGVFGFGYMPYPDEKYVTVVVRVRGY